MARLTLAVTNFLFKLVTTMFVLWVAHRINHGLLLGGWGYFSTALVVSIVGLVIDLTILPLFGNPLALATDLVIGTILILYVPILWHNSRMHFLPALTCAIVITILEAGVHRFMNQTNRLVDQA
jgi:hypothetical protein